MKCADCQKYLPLYLDNECEPREKESIKAHLETCEACRNIRNRLQKEAEAISEAIGMERLPDSFTRSILEQLEPYPVVQQPQTEAVQEVASAPLRKRRNVFWKRALVAACAVVILSITAGALISPAFAAYISSFISRIGGEFGLKRAAEQGFNTPVNQSVTDQGITLEIKDIVADQTRLVVSYVLKDESGNVLPNLVIRYYEENRIYLTDGAGNMISHKPHGLSQGAGYADLLFMLKKPPNDLIVHFEMVNLKPAALKQGNWKLDVPVNLEKSILATKFIPVEGEAASFHGIDLDFEGVTYGPSATRFVVATRRTAEEKEHIEKLTGPGGALEGTSVGDYRLHYRIEDEAGAVITSQTNPGGNRHIYFSPGYSYPLEEGGDGAWRWYGAFVPSVAEEKLWFVLEAIEKTEQADLLIPFRPADLASNPVTKQDDKFSSIFTIKRMEKGTDPTTNESVWLISLTGKMLESDYPRWKLYDEVGKTYEVRTDYSTSVVSGSIDSEINELEQTLIVTGLSTLPDQLTLSLQTAQKRYTDINWKVAIPPNTP
ncbi:DUF4179 domain-containing protein [Brevibacillus reuszeri]|uniref:DUF4179 domain-containing protein n=1 Tax=Brevibacillus reuszeri TaxID=54915 RepID=UPI003D22DEE3